MEQHKEVSQFEVALTNILMADSQTKLKVSKALKNMVEVINIPNTSPVTRDLVTGLFGIPQPPTNLESAGRRLKILEIPFVPMKLIFAGLTIEDLFYFSTLSKRAKQLLENVKVPVEEIRFTVTSSHCEVSIWPKHHDNPPLHLRVEHSIPYFFQNLKQGKFMKVFGVTMGYETDHERLGYWIRKLSCFNEEIFLPMYLQLSAFFKTAFPAESYFFEVKDCDIAKSLLFLKTITNKFYEVRITGQYGCIMQTNKENLSTLLGAFTTDNLFLKVQLDGKYTEPLKTNKVEVERGKWISGETLSNLECEVLKVTDTEISSQEFNGFLNHWKTGGLEHLRTCVINYNPDLDVEIVLEGLEAVKWQVPIPFEDQKDEYHVVEWTWCIWNDKGQMGLVEVGENSFKFFKMVDNLCEHLNE